MSSSVPLVPERSPSRSCHDVALVPRSSRGTAAALRAVWESARHAGEPPVQKHGGRCFAIFGLWGPLLGFGTVKQRPGMNNWSWGT
eukprot:6780736-Pyramimonas_sp.AAC.1